ncbi:hypothetical protein C5748_25115 [Phyllobacterium phragmitis]|uniref:Conjugal transfer protein TrbI n=1 Tax=Phyllobacterium phragmitis TaxID=2670329 RepID=A0A2S9IJS9_9HYPH|nr:hypothetical protein C5748_25115 [Phyllobacterium phragmitis]
MSRTSRRNSSTTRSTSAPSCSSDRSSATEVRAPATRNTAFQLPASVVRRIDSPIRFGLVRNAIVLERLSGADAAGFSGLEDQVDYHWGELFKAAALSTLLSVGTQMGSSSDENSLLEALRTGAADSINQAGQQVVQRSANIQPTLTIRPGSPVRIIVGRDLVLSPWKG